MAPLARRMPLLITARLAPAVAVAVASALALVAVLTDWPARAVGTEAPDVRAIGFEVMGRSMVSFLFAAMTILFAMVGSVMLAKLGGRYGHASIPSEVGKR